MKRRIFSALFTGVFLTVTAYGQTPAPAPATLSSAPGTVFRDCPVCPEMVVIPATKFTIGSSAQESPTASSQPEPKKILSNCMKTIGGVERLRSVAAVSYRTLEHTFIRSVSVSDSLPQIMTYERREIVIQPQERSLTEKRNWQWTESPTQIDRSTRN